MVEVKRWNDELSFIFYFAPQEAGPKWFIRYYIYDAYFENKLIISS